MNPPDLISSASVLPVFTVALLDAEVFSAIRTVRMSPTRLARLGVRSE